MKNICSTDLEVAIKIPKGPVYLARRGNDFSLYFPSTSNSQSQRTMFCKEKNQNALCQLYLGLKAGLSNLEKPWIKNNIPHNAKRNDTYLCKIRQYPNEMNHSMSISCISDRRSVLSLLKHREV